MDIEQQFNDIKNWATTRNILFIEGDFEQSKSAFVELPYKETNSLAIFKQLAEKLDIKVIVYELLDFDKETFKTIDETIDKLEENEIQEAFEKLRSFENKYLGYTFYFFNNGMTYKIVNYLEEADDFITVYKAVNDYIQESDDSNSKILPDEKAKEFGKQLAEHQNYAKLKNRTQRESLAKLLFENQFKELNVEDFYGTTLVVAEAEAYYEIEVKPKKEKELKQKITNLHNKGWTKIKIAAELGISKDTLNKYI